MIKEIFRRILIGIAFGGIFTFIALSIMKIIDFEATVDEIWSNMLAGLLMGIYFGLSSFIFENNSWSVLKKTVIHFCTSITFYYIIAIPVGWIPFTPIVIIISVIIFIVAYFLYWLGFYLYYKKMVERLNKDLQQEK